MVTLTKIRLSMSSKAILPSAAVSGAGAGRALAKAAKQVTQSAEQKRKSIDGDGMLSADILAQTARFEILPTSQQPVLGLARQTLSAAGANGRHAQRRAVGSKAQSRI